MSQNQQILVGVVALAYVVLFYGLLIPSIVFFCRWLHRVVRNTPALGAIDPRWSPAGAVGRCFIPFLNLAHPMSGTLEAWRAADPTRRYADSRTRQSGGVPALIVAWWTLWLVAGLLGRVSFQLSRGSSTLASSDIADLASNVVFIGAAVMAVLVVRKVTARQDQKDELISSGRLV